MITIGIKAKDLSVKHSILHNGKVCQVLKVTENDPFIQVSAIMGYEQIRTWFYVETIVTVLETGKVA